MSQVNFISLTMRNFMSYGNNVTVVDLQHKGTTLILGEDLDDTARGPGANGTGKTTIIQALSYGVYGKPVSNISFDNLVNNINKKNMEVVVTFEIKGTYYQIKRVRKSKSYAAGNYVKYYIRKDNMEFTDKDEKTRDSVGHTNKAIEDAIGIPYDLFCRIVVFSALHQPFLDLPVRHPTQVCQTRIIEELFDLTSLTEKADLLKKQIKNNETQLQIKESKVEQIKREHDRHNKQLTSTKQRVLAWKNQNKQQILELKTKLKKVEGINVEDQRELYEKLTGLENNYNTTLSEQHEIDQGIKTLNRDLKKKNQELKHLLIDKCPYCLQEFPDANKKVNEIKSNISSKEKQKSILEEQYNENDEINEKIGKELNTTRSKITVQNLNELLEIKNQSTNIETQIKNLEEAVNPFQEPYEELEEIELDPIDDEEVKDLRKRIEHQKFLNKLLTKRDSFVRKTLLNKNIPYLNTRLQHYLNDLGLPHTVEFTHELTARISQFGRPLDFGNLSNGQRARVNLGLSLAFRDVLQMLHAKINVCIFDEVLDVGLDTVGVQAAARMLKRKGRDEKVCLFIISHRDEIDSAFDRTLTVQLNQGFSYIKNE